ncbi:MAG: hypothetical protein M0R46_09050 [Candidatus Muirbacterium halophilum]|nr:hypothetical protein [Candidatus Muirbacterium halophilum]MCK9476053.1 hypothetical protein [Candidatus Muirbacterium halophilum]
MKKMFFVVLCITLALNSYAFGNLYQLTADVNGKLEIDGAVDQDVKSGFSLTSEFPLLKLKGFDIGIGTEYQFDRDLSNSAGNFRFWNKYITIKKPLFKTKMHAMTPVLKLGVASVESSNLTFGKLDEKGLFYALGIRYSLGNLAYAEITMSVNEAEIAGTSNDVKYKKLNFTYGTKFDGLAKTKKQIDSF